MREFVASRLRGKEIFGHPAGLYVLFLTEMWERFSFYGMRALLVMYMASYLFTDAVKTDGIVGFNEIKAILESVFDTMTVQQLSSQFYGLYTGLVYFTPLFGGILADRYLGQYKTVYLGGILMAIGHFLMASEQLFIIALLFLIVGNGAFKPNISTQVGNLYKEGDPRRDSAYVIFYMGVNLGAMLSPLVCGTLGQVVGWHWGFGAAGVGMILGLIIYWLGSGLVPHDTLKTKVLEQEKRPLSGEEWRAVFALLVLCFLNIMFWSIYEQQGNTLQLWADQKTNWTFFGVELPSSWFQSLNPFMIVVFAPMLNAIWIWQNRRGKEPSSVSKMGIGCILCGGAYILMILAAMAVPGEERGSLLWLVGTVFVFTMGELYLSPIGLSLVTKVAPRRIVSMMMGAWFLSSFFGNYMTGFIGMFYEVMSKDSFFLMLTAMGVGTGIVLFALKNPIQKAIGKHV